MSSEMSPAYTFVKQAWGNLQRSSAFSWERLNHAMSDTLSIAICGGMRFDIDDFTRWRESGCKWSHDEHYIGFHYWATLSGCYSKACLGLRYKHRTQLNGVRVFNRSAAESVERAMGIEPWNLHGARLCVGAELFHWDAESLVHIASLTPEWKRRVKVTGKGATIYRVNSFGVGNAHLNCSARNGKRLKIHRETLTEQQRPFRERKKKGGAE